MKKVGHRVYENQPGLDPPKGILESCIMHGDFEPTAIFGGTHGTQPMGHPLGVAVLAAITGLRATRYRVPARLRHLRARFG